MTEFLIFSLLFCCPICILLQEFPYCLSTPSAIMDHLCQSSYMNAFLRLTEGAKIKSDVSQVETL